jgi:hypothetical protein
MQSLVAELSEIYREDVMQVYRDHEGARSAGLTTNQEEVAAEEGNSDSNGNLTDAEGEAH